LGWLPLKRGRKWLFHLDIKITAVINKEFGILSKRLKNEQERRRRDEQNEERPMVDGCMPYGSYSCRPECWGRRPGF
jgi:hypothetical protein